RQATAAANGRTYDQQLALEVSVAVLEAATDLNLCSDRRGSRRVIADRDNVALRAIVAASLQQGLRTRPVRQRRRLPRRIRTIRTSSTPASLAPVAVV